MYTLKITELTAQQDMEQFAKVLQRIAPGLSSQQASLGLKAPPFDVISVEHESQAISIKNALEKFGAICVIESSSAPKTNYEPAIPKIITHSDEDKNKFPAIFWVIIISILAVVALWRILSSDSDESKPAATQRPPVQAPAAQKPPAPKTEKPAAPKAEKPAPKTERPATDYAAKNKNDLSSALSKNPYNTGAWKALYEKLEKEGDTASARKAKDSYDKALRAQQVLASLAKTFGNGTRVEVEEEAVYYRTSRDLTDSEFYYEAEKLRESLNEKFPTKDMVLENYKSDNKVQSVRLKATYSNTSP